MQGPSTLMLYYCYNITLQFSRYKACTPDASANPRGSLPAYSASSSVVRKTSTRRASLLDKQKGAQGRQSCLSPGRTVCAGPACTSRWMGKAGSSTRSLSSDCADAEIRMRLPACMEDWVAGEGEHPKMEDLRHPAHTRPLAPDRQPWSIGGQKTNPSRSAGATSS